MCHIPSQSICYIALYSANCSVSIISLRIVLLLSSFVSCHFFCGHLGLCSLPSFFFKVLFCRDEEGQCEHIFLYS